ncbi:hypothetical protein D3C86_2216030 [compost metagenome]
MQNRFRITVRLLPAFQHKFDGGLKSDRSFKVGRHRQIGRISGILAIDHGGHALHGLNDLLLRNHAMA